MEPIAYEEFRTFESTHWWFLGRHAIFEHLLRTRVVPALPKRPLLSVDLGCGMGAHLELLGRHGTAVGTDVCPDAVRHCHARGFQRVLLANGEALPFASDSVDVVTAFDTLEHIPDDAATVRDCFRVLRSGGRMFISGPAWQFLYSHQDQVVHHQRRYTTGGIRRLFEAAGFEVRHASYINFFLFPVIVPVVLLRKLKEAIKPPGPGEHHSNVSVAIPRWLNRLLLAIFAFERHIIARCPVPFGHSLILIARKP